MIIRIFAICQVMAKEFRAGGGASGSGFSITVANFCVSSARVKIHSGSLFQRFEHVIVNIGWLSLWWKHAVAGASSL